MQTTRVPWLILLAAVGILSLALIAPLLLKGNEVAQGIFGVTLALVTTLTSVYATRHYARAQSKDELTRYGLQAWRNLDSLEIKVSQQLGESASDSTLEAWLLDIDQAKWAWRDLLREVFELQARLQIETDEIASRYKVEIAEAKTPDDKSALQSRQAAELAKVVSKAPLPLRIPEEIICPNCTSTVTARLGSSAGETAWPKCGNCGVRFSVHRQADGGTKVGDLVKRPTVIRPCPACHTDVALSVPDSYDVEFETKCPTCRTHIQFRGNALNPTLTDLGVSNSTYDCPNCGSATAFWISPARRVSFVAYCEQCGARARVVGQLGDVAVYPIGPTPQVDQDAAR